MIFSRPWHKFLIQVSILHHHTAGLISKHLNGKVVRSDRKQVQGLYSIAFFDQFVVQEDWTSISDWRSHFPHFRLMASLAATSIRLTTTVSKQTSQPLKVRTSVFERMLRSWCIHRAEKMVITFSWGISSLWMIVFTVLDGAGADSRESKGATESETAQWHITKRWSKVGAQECWPENISSRLQEESYGENSTDSWSAIRFFEGTVRLSIHSVRRPSHFVIAVLLKKLSDELITFSRTVTSIFSSKYLCSSLRGMEVNWVSQLNDCWIQFTAVFWEIYHFFRNDSKSFLRLRCTTTIT